jgi:hypothetical protein
MSTENNQAVTISFGVKMATGNYENEDLRVSITAMYPDSFKESELMVEAEELSRQVKAMTYKEAGVDFDLTDDGLVMRRLTKSVRADNNTPNRSEASAKPSGGYEKKPRAAGNAGSGGRRVNADAQALWVSLAETSDPRSDFFDNRDRIVTGQYKPSAPYFKHKKSDAKLFVSDCPADLKDLFVGSDGKPHYESVADFS